jgi:hypothetical protein
MYKEKKEICVNFAKFKRLFVCTKHQEKRKDYTRKKRIRQEYSATETSSIFFRYREHIHIFGSQKYEKEKLNTRIE